MKYYIVSLSPRHQNQEMIVFWRPDNAGYTYVLEQAGKYDEALVKSKKHYYDNKKDTVAIPCDLIEANATKVLLNTTSLLNKIIDISDKIVY